MGKKKGKLWLLCVSSIFYDDKVHLIFSDFSVTGTVHKELCILSATWPSEDKEQLLFLI
jgi:hypothetical protein